MSLKSVPSLPITPFTPASVSADPELLALLDSVIQTNKELLRRIERLERTERIRAALQPPANLGIDY
ncbi:hypothetical protein [Deinococcus sonorensis]|uniref:Uncharacterized protein n=2 Tax=Deinococcus sonorensis TaxID=309891 RepID=A0AAU7U532_9DEIO